MFYLNGEPVIINELPDPHMTLIAYLRSKNIHLVGTKLGCGEGGCGACTVAVIKKNPLTGEKECLAINSCLARLCALDGCHIQTVEGIGSVEAPHPVQKAISEENGSQCGFCSPGIVMSLYSTLQSNPNPTLHDIEESLDGNLCRCSGYRSILDAGKTFAVDKHLCAKTGQPCKKYQPKSQTAELIINTTASRLLEESKKSKEEATKPVRSELPVVDDTAQTRALHFSAETVNSNWKASPFSPSSAQRQAKAEAEAWKRHEWLKPICLDGLLKAKLLHGAKATFIGGNTEVGIQENILGKDFSILISTAAVPELNVLKVESSGALEVGGAVTLTQLANFIKAQKKSYSDVGFGTLLAIGRILKWFASSQIRNVATVAGNIVTASPISDLNPILIATDATLNIQSKEAKRSVPARQFFKGYRTVDLQPEEVLVSVTFPATRKNEYILSYKQARRRDDDISIVTCCFRALLEEKSKKFSVSEFYCGIGGMAIVTIQCPRISDELKGEPLPLSSTAIEKIRHLVDEALPLKFNVPGGMPGYRRALCASFLLRFFAEVSNIATGEVPTDNSMAESFLNTPRLLTTGAQVYVRDAKGKGLHHSHACGKEQHSNADAEYPDGAQVIGKPLMHQAALLQCTGEVQYTDDIPNPHNCLYAALVVSKEHSGTIVDIDASEALKIPGVKNFFCAKDLTNGTNAFGVVPPLDEEVFRSSTIQSVGQCVGMIVAETSDIAWAASRKVNVILKDISENPVITCADAIKAKSFGTERPKVEQGNIEKGFAEAQHIVEGEFRIGGQEHFYLEPVAALAVPGDTGEMTLFVGSQNPTHSQNRTASVLGGKCNKVVVRVKRIGGGFGGKETRTAMVSTPVVWAAAKLKRAVRICMPRDMDMLVKGTRHPFHAKYKVGFTNEGRITALQASLYNNGGYSKDLSYSIMDRALFHIDNVYQLPNMHVEGLVCMTNTVTNTAFRGFGGPQGMLVAEVIQEHIASVTKVPPPIVRERNMYKDGDRTHFGQLLENFTVPRLWQQALELAEFASRSKDVEAFNAKHSWRKRGIALIPTKFGINYTANFLNQAGALVHVYTDGSVLVAHGGTEMGQGLHTKMIQIAARALDVPTELVHISETNTNQVANASPTAASVSSDHNGMAVLDACEQIRERLKPYWAKVFAQQKIENPTPQDRASLFRTVVFQAYLDRVNLSANGFYKAPTTQYLFDKVLKEGETNADRGCPFNYFTCGVSCAETEIDVLTGDMHIVRADVMMDLGNSLNPAIDIGQIEGAFIQGVGWCMMEETIWGGGEGGQPWLKPGACFTRGPGTYKIPSFGDVPLDFRVSLLGDAPNPRAIHSSKAVGEPPYFTSASVFFATRNAIAAARQQFLPKEEAEKFFFVDSPLTAERIRMAVGDPIATEYQAKVVKEGGAERPALFC